MNHHKFWFVIASAVSVVYSLAVAVFVGVAVYFAICVQPGKSLAMIGFALLCVLGSIGYFQWAERERNKYF